MCADEWISLCSSYRLIIDWQSETSRTGFLPSVFVHSLSALVSDTNYRKRLFVRSTFVFRPNEQHKIVFERNEDNLQISSEFNFELNGSAEWVVLFIYAFGCRCLEKSGSAAVFIVCFMLVCWTVNYRTMKLDRQVFTLVLTFAHNQRTHQKKLAQCNWFGSECWAWLYQAFNEYCEPKIYCEH